MPGEVRVFKYNGYPIGVIYPVKAVQFSWSLDDVGAGTFQLPIKGEGSRWNDTYLDHYHLVEYHCSEIDQVWTGVMIKDQPSDNGDGTITCLSAEHLFTKRFINEWTQFIGTSGQIAEFIVNQAQRIEPLGPGIVLGDIDYTGTTYYLEYENKECKQALDELAKLTGGSWWIEKTGHNHSDPWLFRWAKARGTDKQGNVVLSGEIITKPNIMREASDLATFAYGLGVEVDGARLKIQIVDDTAQRKYGRLETTLEFPDIIDPNLLTEATVRKLTSISGPHKSFGINIDNRRGTWNQIRLGDTVRAILSQEDFTGYDGPVRILGEQLNKDDKLLGLVVEALR